MDQIEVHIIQMQLIEAMLREERNPDRIAAKFATAARAAIGSGSVQEMQVALRVRDVPRPRCLSGLDFAVPLVPSRRRKP
jgi:uncharacterized protein with PIN domain